jgi:hypothetical protein
MKMRFCLMLPVTVSIGLSAFAQTVTVGKYTTHQDSSKAFIANLRAIPNTKFTLRSSDKSGGTIQAGRLVRNQELASLFILVTQRDAGTVLIEATFTKNGGWFGGGNPNDWAKEYAEELKSFLPDLAEATDQGPQGAGTDASELERVVSLRVRERISLGITRRRVTIDSVEITGWPSADTITKAASEPDANSKVVVVLTYSNRSDEDWKCDYVVSILDETDHEIGTGTRSVSLDEGEVGDTHRVGITMRTADVGRASKVRVRVVPR